MKTVKRHFELDAGHRLAEHQFKCQNLHGHRYVFDIEITGEIHEKTGLLMDFSHIKAPIMDAFDHNTLLNSEDPLTNSDIINFIEDGQEYDLYIMDCEPTVENIADEAMDLIFNQMTEDERKRIDTVRIKVAETPNCKVESDYLLDSDGQAYNK